MTDQLDFSAVTDEAIARVKANADEEWYAAALDALHDLARSREAFTADELQPLLAGLGRPHEPRVVGAVMREGARRHWITKTDEYRPSSLARNHAAPRVLWRSLLVRPDVTPAGEAARGPGRPNH